MAGYRQRPGSTQRVTGFGLAFTSRRERRLWIWIVSIIVAIYSTLGLAQVLAAEFRRQNLLGALFGASFVLILLAIAALGLKLRPGRLEVGVALGVAAVYTLVFVRMAIPEERTHVIEYGVLAILVHEALAERRQNGGKTPPPTVLALALASFIGVIDEVIQLFLPSRVFDVADMITNSASVALALGAKLVLGWARDRRP